MHSGRFLKSALIGGAIVLMELAGPGQALAHGPPDYLLSCENGRTYPIRARAVTVDGDLVTGYVWTHRGRGAHIRIVPMGAGYRYIAPGLWIDGWRADAEMNFGPTRSIPCTVSRP
jgi:hypothetical protein